MSDREDLIAQYIDELKAQVGAETDSDLARRLSVDKRTVSAWRSRQSIPRKFMAMIRGDANPEASGSVIQMNAPDRYAFALALFRYSRAQACIATGGNFRETWDAFHSSLGFWELMREARKDINAMMKDRASNLETAFALVMHDDLSTAEETTRRDRAVIANAGTTRD